MKKSTKRLIKAAISICFFGLLFYFINTEDLVEVFRDIDPLFFTLSILLIVVMVSSSCLKWFVSLKLTGERVPLKQLAGIYLIGYYFSNLLPSNIGGDVVRSYYLGRKIDNQAVAAASVFVERFTGILFMLFLVVVAPLLRTGFYKSPYAFVPAFGALCLLIISISVLCLKDPVGFARNVSERVIKLLRLSPTGFIARLVDKFLKVVNKVHSKVVQAFKVAKGDRSAMIQMVVLTVWFYGLTWVNVYWAFKTFGADPSFWDIAAVTPVIMFVSMIPISLGSLGLAEGAYVFYFSMIGMEPALALAVGLFMRFKVLLVGVIGVFSYLAHSHEVNRSMVEEAAEE